MIEDLYTEKLNWFKQNEKPEAVLLMADNLDLVKIIIAWASMDVKRADRLTRLPGGSESEAWGWLWENKMKPLIGNRIIYPEGMVNSFVERYLREQVVKLFEVKPKKSIKKG
jgi:hypothetical protein